jgi:hypothetical protein
MTKTYVTSLKLRYLFDNQLVFNCLFIGFMSYLLTWAIQIIIFLNYFLSYDLFINILYDDYLITYYTCKYLSIKLQLIIIIIKYIFYNQIEF